MFIPEAILDVLIHVGVWLPIRFLVSVFFEQDLPYDFESTVIPAESYDFVIVGAGAGGCVVAARLAEVGADVLLLEEGKSAPPESTLAFLGGTVVVLPSDAVKRPKTVQNQDMTMGRVVGGGTSVNSMATIRGCREDYDYWANLGNVGWDYDSILPYFKISEDKTGKDFPETEGNYGKGGPLPIKTKDYTNPVASFMLEAGKEMGYREIDASAPNKIGFSITHVQSSKGIRMSTSETFLRPLMTKKNIMVRTQAKVGRILIDDNRRAYGVQYRYQGKIRSVMARKEVIISAGGIASPHLLMLSGIGPPAHLKQIGIPLTVPVNGVGSNFQDHHYLTKLVWDVKGRKQDSLIRYGLKDLKNLYKSRTGRLSEPQGPDSSIFLNLKDPDNSTWPDTLISVNLDENTLQMHIILARPKSIGSVRLRSTNDRDDPIIDSNLLSHPQDIKTLRAAIKVAFKLVDTPAMKKNLKPRLNIKFGAKKCRQFNMQTQEFWDCFIKQNFETYWHPSGTCKMAPSSDPMGVVDNTLKVRGVKSLRVIDASIMPQIITANTMRTVIMIAEKGVDMIKKEHGYPTLVSF